MYASCYQNPEMHHVQDPSGFFSQRLRPNCFFSLSLARILMFVQWSLGHTSPHSGSGRRGGDGVCSVIGNERLHQYIEKHGICDTDHVPNVLEMFIQIRYE